jgi:Zn-dependent protease/CBS domain-containing protein
MQQSLRLGRIRGIDVGAHWSVLIITLLLVQILATSILPGSVPRRSDVAYWSVALVASVAFLASLLAHELAHALVARHYGIRVRRITLWLLGGVSELESEAPNPRADLLVALAGPAASMASAVIFAAGAVVSRIAGLPSLAVAALAWLTLVNLTLAVFNLLPGAPLDGGRVLRAILWRASGDRAAAQRRAGRAGSALGALLGAAGITEIVITGSWSGLWLVLIGWFLMSAAGAEIADTQARTALGSMRVADVMTTPPICGYASQTVDAFVHAVARHHPHRHFPVVDLDGHPLGVLSLAQLSRVPASQRGLVRLREVALTPVAILTPTQPLAEAVATAGRRELSPVVEDGRLVGVLTRGDLTRAIDLGMLGVRPDATRMTEAPFATR